mmetsp:Transcript_116000/g.182453  ORF Transcript_116000/g.182453 Transcript_116000/m.182453 type:complete len:311 (+) Transcript_116000:97-1029(+)
MTCRFNLVALICLILVSGCVGRRAAVTRSNLTHLNSSRDEVLQVTIETDADMQETMQLAQEGKDGVDVEQDQSAQLGPPKLRTKPDLSICEKLHPGDPCILITNDYCKDTDYLTGFERRRDLYMAMPEFAGLSIEKTCIRATQEQAGQNNKRCCISQDRPKPWRQGKIDIPDDADNFVADLAESFEELEADGTNAEEVENVDLALRKVAEETARIGDDENEIAQRAIRACAQFAAKPKKKKGRKDNMHNCKAGADGAQLFRNHPNRYKGLPKGYECRQMTDADTRQPFCGACKVMQEAAGRNATIPPCEY